MKRRASAAIITTAIGLLMVSCPNPFDDKDLRDRVAEEVAAATAEERVLTVEPSANGIVSPSGAIVVKDNVPFPSAPPPFRPTA